MYSVKHVLDLAFASGASNMSPYGVCVCGCIFHSGITAEKMKFSRCKENCFLFISSNFFFPSLENMDINIKYIRLHY